MPDEAVVAVGGFGACLIADRRGVVGDAGVGDEFLQEVDAVVHLHLGGRLEFGQAFHRDEGSFGDAFELILRRRAVADAGQAGPAGVAVCIVEADAVQEDAVDAGEASGQRHVRVQPVLVEVMAGHIGARLQRHDQGQAVGGRGHVVISPHRGTPIAGDQRTGKLYAVQTVCSSAWLGQWVSGRICRGCWRCERLLAEGCRRGGLLCRLLPVALGPAERGAWRSGVLGGAGCLAERGSAPGCFAWRRFVCSFGRNSTRNRRQIPLDGRLKGSAHEPLVRHGRNKR